MGLKAMVTVDLNEDVTSSQRETFNSEMAEQQWAKIKPLTTTWHASFEDDLSKDRVVSMTKSDIAAAAKTAEIKSYDAAVMVGDELPTVFMKA